MKRWVILTALVVALSAAATVAVQLLPETGVTGSAAAFPVAPKVVGPKPKAVVEGERTFAFGTLPQHVTGKHSWVVRNEGEGTLEMWMISSTCSCTLAKFKNGEKAVVKPGESTEITLEYETRTNNGDYEKGAEIGTNDPALPQFPLHVRGKVYPAIQTYPPLPDNVLNMLSISNDVDDHPYHIAVFSKDRPETQILKAASSKHVAVKWEPMSAEDLKAIDNAGGTKLTVDVKSSLPLGFFREEVVLTTDHPKQPELKLTVTGKMEGPINFIPGRIRISSPPVNGKLGGRGELIITVRESRETKFEVVKAPKRLTAEVVPIDEKKGRYRLVVTVPPGTPAADIEDEVEIRTDHPKAERVFVPVSILITDGP
jgi:hypothetical protein